MPRRYFVTFTPDTKWLDCTSGYVEAAEDAADAVAQYRANEKDPNSPHMFSTGTYRCYMLKGIGMERHL